MALRSLYGVGRQTCTDWIFDPFARSGLDFLFHRTAHLVPRPLSFSLSPLFSLEDALLSGNPLRTLASGISFRLASSKDPCVMIGKNLVDGVLDF